MAIRGWVHGSDYFACSGEETDGGTVLEATLGCWPVCCSPYSAAMKNSLLVKHINSIL